MRCGVRAARRLVAKCPFCFAEDFLQKKQQLWEQILQEEGLFVHRVERGIEALSTARLVRYRKDIPLIDSGSEVMPSLRSFMWSLCSCVAGLLQL
mmetsp:Transcript_105599/g.274880  ORF Transcript_105599/g.274880 Transcript_105599/m.274880 type:complete len:95 (+) Transcript_105599:523-807(+)